MSALRDSALRSYRPRESTIGARGSSSSTRVLVRQSTTRGIRPLTERRMHASLISIMAAGAGALLALGAMAAPRSALPLADNSPTAVPVDVELVLAVDVSYSMDPEEQALQREGYIAGITSRDFMQALRSGQHGKVAVAYFAWAGPDDQKTLLAWRVAFRPAVARAAVHIPPTAAPQPAAAPAVFATLTLGV